MAEPSTPLPDYMTDPDAVLKDSDVQWRYGRPPNYSKTRKTFAETKTMSHEPGSLPQLVENLVKNWEIEASFKPNLADWRTVDHATYSFAMGGHEPQPAEHMLRLGTYNAIISPNEYYSPDYSDFASSHKTFKRMMPTFAWEVLEVYSPPPVVAFRWRHWGVMKNDYVGYNNKAEKVTAKAHGGPIDIEGMTVAHVNEHFQITKLETWMDPLEMFRQIAPEGIVSKAPVDINPLPNQSSFADYPSSRPEASGPDVEATTMSSIAGCPVMGHHSSLPPSETMSLAGCPMAKQQTFTSSPPPKETCFEPAAAFRHEDSRPHGIKATLGQIELAGSNATLSTMKMGDISGNEQEGEGSVNSDSFWDPVYTPDDASTHEVKPLSSEPKLLDGLQGLADMDTDQGQSARNSLAPSTASGLEEVDDSMEATYRDPGKVAKKGSSLFLNY